MWLAIIWFFAIVLLLGLAVSRGDGLALLNFVVLQWFWFRYVKVEDAETLKFVRMGWQGPVVPLTGWWTETLPRYPHIVRTREERLAEEKEGSLVKRKRKHGGLVRKG